MTVFYTGTKFICPPCADVEEYVELRPSSLRMDVDLERYSEADAARMMTEVVRFNPIVGNMLLTQTLLGLTRPLYIDIGEPPKCTLCIVSDSGFGKTVFAPFVTQIYNRREGIKDLFQLKSSVSSINTFLSENHDCTVVFDDLHPIASTNEKVALKKSFLHVCRTIGNQIAPAKMAGKKILDRPVKCNAVITAEFPEGLGSDAARSLVIKMKTSIFTGKFQEYQHEKLLVPTFYYYFLHWYIENYEMNKKLLEKWLYGFRERNKTSSLNNHLKSAYFCYDSIYKLFLLYCISKRFTKPESAKNKYKSFQNMLKGLIKEQNERAKEKIEKKADEINLFKLICKIFNEKEFNLTKNKKHFDDCKHDGYIYDRILYLRSDKLLKKVKITVPTATKKKIRKALEYADAIDFDGENKNIKGVNNLRFVKIPLSKLK
jgi:hypothetical protein